MGTGVTLQRYMTKFFLCDGQGAVRRIVLYMDRSGIYTTGIWSISRLFVGLVCVVGAPVVQDKHWSADLVVPGLSPT